MTKILNSNFENAMQRLGKRIPNNVLKWSPNINNGPDSGKLVDGLRDIGIDVRSLTVEPQAYRAYLQRAKYKERRPGIYKTNFIEKTFEHYIGFELLKLKKEDVFLDIAGCHSPVCKIFEDLSGCLGYSHDLIYRQGVNGKRIGSDASDIPLPNSSLNGAVAACSIEHFEGIADILWMKEMSRLLKKDGKVIVAPLYMNIFNYFVTDPLNCPDDDVIFDDPHCNVYARENYGNRHGRHYSPKTLWERLLKPNSNSMTFTLYMLENAGEIDKSIYCKFVLEGKKNNESK